MNDGSNLKLADVLTLLYYMLGTPASNIWNTDMMNYCGDWDFDGSLSLADVFEILYYMLGAKTQLYPLNTAIHWIR